MLRQDKNSTHTYSTYSVHTSPSIPIHTSSMNTSSTYSIICEICRNLTIHQEDVDGDVVCIHCGHTHIKKQNISALKCLLYALTALIFYIPANLLPFMTFEMYGNKNEATIWSGIVSLAEGGSWFLAFIVFVASMLVPFLKIVTLFYLGLFGSNQKNQIFKTKIYHFIEVIGPWSMLDVFLLAVLVAIIKLDAMATVSAGPGSFMFLFVVIFTIFASKNFNQKLIWQKKEI